MEKKEIIVKVLLKEGVKAGNNAYFTHRFFPHIKSQWGRCHFVFEDESDYDWLVVYDELSGQEDLSCSRDHTILVTSEPSSIKTYDSHYLKQFKYVLTGQENWAIKHPGKIHSQPALLWFYGQNSQGSRSFSEIAQNIPEQKKSTLSTVCSAKQQKHTLHHQRYLFTKELRELLPELDQFGKGVKEIADKADALDPYKYHIAIENHVCDHWWTEKLSDAFLGLTLPFYFGAPNAADYFPAESFIPIDINDVQGSYQIIRQAIENNEYEKRLPAIKQARQLILDSYNLFATLSKIIEEKHPLPSEEVKPFKLLSRHALRKNPAVALQVGLEKIRGRLISRLKR